MRYEKYHTREEKMILNHEVPSIILEKGNKRIFC